MTERETISEESTVRDDSIGGLPKGWTRDDTSPSLTSELEQLNSLIDNMIQARISDVIKENNELKEKLREMARISEENIKLRNVIIDLNLQINDYKQKYKEAPKTISAYESGNTSLTANYVEYDAASMADKLESLENDLRAFKTRDKNGKETSMFTAKQTAIILKAFLLEQNSLTNNTKSLAPLLQRFGGWSHSTAENALGYEVTQEECDKLAKEFDGYAPKIGNIIRAYPQKYDQIKHKRLQNNLKS